MQIKDFTSQGHRRLNRFFLIEIVTMLAAAVLPLLYSIYMNSGIYALLHLSASTDAVICNIGSSSNGFLIFLFLLFPFIFVVQLILFFWWKLYKERRYVKRIVALVAGYMGMCYILLCHYEGDANNPYYLDCSNLCEPAFAYYAGYPAGTLRKASVSEYKKGSDFTDLLRKFDLEIDPSSSDPSGGHLSSLGSIYTANDWLFLINDTIEYRITAQKVSPIPHCSMMSCRWVPGMTSYRINGREEMARQICLIGDSLLLRNNY